jgi:hypothetical protein
MILHGCMDSIMFVIFFIFLSSFFWTPPQKLLIKGGHGLQRKKIDANHDRLWFFLILKLEIS